MNLKLLFKIYAVLQTIQGLLMLFGGSMISEMNQWANHSPNMVVMAVLIA